MVWSASEPYDGLPLLPPATALETAPVLKAAIEARAALAALDQGARRMPNPTVLLNAVSLLEAQASSEVENIVTTTDDLFRQVGASETSMSPEMKETLRYRAAIFAGVESLRRRPLSVTTAVEVCSAVQGREMQVRSLPGTIIANPVSRVAIYTPPVGERVIRDKLSNWTTFVHERDALDPLVRLGVAHYQFEAIHPFVDGNGRTGRILNILMLIELGLLRDPVLYLSRYIIRHRDDYYRLLLEVTASQAWEPWLLFILDGVRETAQSTLRTIDAVQALLDVTRDRMRGSSPGPNSDLLDVLFEQPYCRITDVVDRCGVSRQTAAKWLRELVVAGVVLEQRIGREVLFINRRLLEILIDYRPEPQPTLF